MKLPQQEQTIRERIQRMTLLTSIFALGFLIQSIYFGFNFYFWNYLTSYTKSFWDYFLDDHHDVEEIENFRLKSDPLKLKADWLLNLTIFCFWIPQIVMIFFLLNDHDKALKLKNKRNDSKSQSFALEINSSNDEDIEIALKEVSDGKSIFNSKRQAIGIAPHAARPNGLFPSSDINIINNLSECGQKFVHPAKWTLSIANFILTAEAIMQTETWSELSKAKGSDNNVTIHDVNQHFSIPWTRGSDSSSIALNFEPRPRNVELILSHSWSGSFKQTLAAIKTLITVHLFSPETLVFFGTFSQYQAEDNVVNGLTIAEQLAIKVFDKVIETRPKYGMAVIHTTLSEVHDRLWCVDEVHKARKAGIKVFGLFDPSVWSLLDFHRTATIQTENATCFDENDGETI